MLIRNMRKSDYAAVDRLLLQIHQVDVNCRPDMFSPIDQYMTRESYGMTPLRNVYEIAL